MNITNRRLLIEVSLLAQGEKYSVVCKSYNGKEDLSERNEAVRIHENNANISMLLAT